MAQRYCAKCRRTLADTNFYTLKSGEKSDLCKACETMHVNNTDPTTFTWLLEKYDVPWIPAEWDILYKKAYQKDPYKINGMSVLGKYISKMKLKQWKNFTYADSEMLQQEAEAKAKMYGEPKEVVENKIAEMEESYKNGEITEAQFLTYKEINQPQEDNTFPVNDNPFEQVDIPDPSENLTLEDKVYLATKWGRLYSAQDWVYLEKKYNDFMESFDIQGAAREDTLIQICKLSLKMNQSIDTMDMDSYSKLARTYDALMKSAKFTEAQKKDEQNTEFSCYGQIVAYAEEKSGHIPRLPKMERDIVDKDIEDIKTYNKSLIDEDPAIFKLIEQYIKKREILLQQEEDQKEAAEKGEDFVSITDKDLADYNKFLNDSKEKDSES